jgi:hypothetical protein
MHCPVPQGAGMTRRAVEPKPFVPSPAAREALVEEPTEPSDGRAHGSSERGRKGGRLDLGAVDQDRASGRELDDVNGAEMLLHGQIPTMDAVL